jgi:hypothetical protein
MIRLSGLVVVLLVAAGCGPSTGQVDGKLVWADGKPAVELDGGEVVFEAVAGGLSARGLIGPDGGFRLRTGEADGAPVGQYKVAVVEFQKLLGEGQMAPPLLDPKFRSFESSGLTAAVTAGTAPLTLTVTKAPVRK